MASTKPRRGRPTLQAMRLKGAEPSIFESIALAGGVSGGGGAETIQDLVMALQTHQGASSSNTTPHPHTGHVGAHPSTSLGLPPSIASLPLSTQPLDLVYPPVPPDVPAWDPMDPMYHTQVPYQIQMARHEMTNRLARSVLLANSAAGNGGGGGGDANDGNDGNQGSGDGALSAPHTDHGILDPQVAPEGPPLSQDGGQVHGSPDLHDGLNGHAAHVSSISLEEGLEHGFDLDPRVAASLHQHQHDHQQQATPSELEDASHHHHHHQPQQPPHHDYDGHAHLQDVVASNDEQAQENALAFERLQHHALNELVCENCGRTGTAVWRKIAVGVDEHKRSYRVCNRKLSLYVMTQEANGQTLTSLLQPVDYISKSTVSCDQSNCGVM